jgi:hypothetical protein
MILIRFLLPTTGARFCDDFLLNSSAEHGVLEASHARKVVVVKMLMCCVVVLANLFSVTDQTDHPYSCMWCQFVHTNLRSGGVLFRPKNNWL